MKQLLTLLASCLLGSVLMAQPCVPNSTVPFLEDFETFTVGTPGIVGTNWTRTSSNTGSLGWFVDNGGTGSGSTGPSADHTTGTSAGIYMFTEASSPTVLGDTFTITSPCIDLVGTTAPRLTFWYHMYGLDIGTLEVHILDGTSDVILWSLSGEQQTAETDPYRQAIVDLDAYVGMNINIAFVSIRGNDFTGDMAIDDIAVFQIPDVDVVANAILSPQSDCGLTATEAVTVQVINLGALPLSNATASFSLNGSPFGAPELIPGSIAPGDTLDYTFTATVDLSAPGVHSLVVVATQTSPADTLNLNDTVSVDLVSIPLVNSFPYYEDFEAGFGGWTPDLVNSPNSSWAFGTPTKPTIQGASSGINAWMTGGLSGSYPANENSALNGPCFDFTTLPNPVVRMDVWWNSEFSWDGAVLQSSIDAGLSWQNVGAFGDPNNWYNDNSLGGSPAGQDEGWTGRASTGNGSGGYVRAEHLLDGLGGESDVLLRIVFGSDGTVQDDGFAVDNINIFEQPPINSSMLSSSAPNDGCGLTASEAVTVSFTNVGTTAITNFPISYSINGGTPVSEQYTVSLPAGDTAIYTFTTTADLSTPAIYSFEAWTTVPGDPDGFNDTIRFSVQHFTPDVLPYLEDFQTFIPGAPLPAGWTIEINSASTGVGWEVNQGGTGSTGTGPNADHTLGNAGGVYFFTETSGGVEGDFYTLTSNCIDLTGASFPKLSFWYHMHGGDMGSLEAKIVRSDGTEVTLWQVSGQQQPVQSDPYLEAFADLAPYVGEVVQLRFVGTRGNGFEGDIALDDISIKEPAPIDAFAIAVEGPLSGCGLGTSETVSATLVNFGSAPLANAVASYSVDGGAFISPETIGSTIAQGDTFTYTFTTQADLSAAGYHEIVVVTTSLSPADTLNANDTTRLRIINYPQATAFPYSENFENGEGGWLAGGVNSSWEFGTPAKSTIQGASSGVNAFVTGGLTTGTYNSDEQSWVVSPCFDFSTLSAASISLDIWYETSNADGAVMQSSIDGGLSWQNVGDFGDPNNWFNDDNITAIPGGSVEGWTGTGASGTGAWVTARHNLDGLAGESAVIIRMAFGSGPTTNTDGIAFDNVNIFQAPPIDMHAEVILSPTSPTCFSAAEDVVVQLINKGSMVLDFAANNTTVGANITGPNPQVVSSAISAGTLAPDDTLDYTITVPADLSTPGFYTLQAFVSAPGDTLNGNDTTGIITVQSVPLLLGTLTEDFETFDPITSNGWIIDNPATGVGWTTGNGGANSTGTGPAVDLTTGTAAGTLLFTETSGGAQGDKYSFLSPCIDLSVNPDPKLAWGWHMFGGDMGTLEVHIRTATIDSIVFTQIGEFQTAEADPWELDTVDLSFVGNEVIQIEFVGFRGTGFESDMAIDDINVIFFSPEDVAPVALIQPVSDCGLADTSIVEISYTNAGTDTVRSVNLSYNLNGGAYTTETVVGLLSPGQTKTYSFIARADLSVAGTYSIGIVTDAANDLNKFNDTISFNVDNRPVVSVFPYTESFENGNGGWSAGGISSTWALGSPAKTTIQGASDGSNAWVTGGLGTDPYNNNESSFVLGPCFDFSVLDSPTVFLDVWWNSEFSWDGAVLQTSVDNGANWQTIGNFGDPDNWYTDNTIGGTPGGSDEGWSGRASTNNGSDGWVTAKHRLFGLGGEPEVNIRIAFGSDGTVQDDGFAFDNIRVTGLIDEDAGVTTLIYPLGECGLTVNDSIVLGVSNLGRDTLNGPITLNYIFNGGTQQSIQVPGPILPNRGVLATISNVDLSAPGPYTLTAWTSGIAGDTNAFNDSIDIVIESNPGTPIPISDNFNAYPDGEVVFADLINNQDDNLDWEVNFGGTGSTATGPADDVTGGGGYIYIETSGSVHGDIAVLETNCLDLTNATNPQLFFSYHMFGSSIESLSINVEDASGIAGVNTEWLASGQQQASETDPWITDTVDLSAYTGKTVKITFVGEIKEDAVNETFHGDMALDNIEIRELLANDLGVSQILSPVGEDCGNDSTLIEVEIINYGTNAQSNFPVTANVSGGTVASVTGTFTGAIDAGDTATFIIGGFNANTGGVMNITAFTALGSDQLAGNNSTDGIAVFAISPEAPVAVNESVCFIDTTSFDLSVTGVADAFYWYDSLSGGSLVNLGSSYTTPLVNSSVSYFVEARSFRPRQLETSLIETANEQDGSMFDITALNGPIIVDSFDVNIDGAAGPNITVEVYYLDSTFQTSFDGISITNPGDWTLLGTTTVTSMGEGNSTRVPVGGITIPNGETFGFYVTATGVEGLTHDFGSFNYGGDGINLSAGISVAYPFGGATNTQVVTNRSFSGRVYYSNLGCSSDRVPVTGTILAPVPVDLGPDGIECEGFLLDATNPTFVSYDWGNGIITPTLNADTTGSYVVNVVDNLGCAGADTVVLIINDAPDVNLGPDASNCNSVTLDAGNPGASYIWSVPGQFAQTLDVDQSGTYSVSVNQLGCESTDTITVTILPGPIVDLGGDREICTPLTLDAENAGSTYLWSTGENSQTIMVMPPPTGTSDTISVVVTSANGCNDTEEIIITGGTPPTVDLGLDQVACDNLMLDAGNPGAIYTWSTGETSQTISVTQSGSISVVIEENGCTASDTVDVTINTVPAADFTFDAPNYLFTYDFTNTSGGGSDSVSWDFGDGVGVSSDQNPSYTYALAGAFEVTLIVVNDCGADTTKQILAGVAIDEEFEAMITVYPNPTVDVFFVDLNDIGFEAEELTIEVTDSRGRSVFKQVKENVFGSYRQRVDLTEHAEGVYLVRISDGIRTANKRIVRK